MSASKGELVGRADPKRLLSLGPLTLLASVIAVTCIRQVAVSLLNPNPEFLPLTVAQPIFDTVLFGGMAVFAFFRMRCYDLDPIA